MIRSRELVSLFGAALVTQAGCDANQDELCAGQTYEPPPAPEPEASTPAVENGRWLSATTLELQLTAPVSSEGELDPVRFGVLGFSVISYQGENECYVRTRYDWLGAIGSYYSISMGVDSAWIGPEDDTLLRLQIPLFEACPNPGTPGEIIGSGILMVYAGLDDNAGNRLLDAQGNPLGDIGTDWAIERIERCINSADCAVNGGTTEQLSQLTSFVQIPCPGS